MHFTSTVVSFLASALAAQAITVSYDTGYDDAGRPLTAVACSDGNNGLITRYGWQTQGNARNFPYIGGSFEIPGWNSPKCGQCYSLSWNGKTIYILGIDRAGDGFNIGQIAMNDLTNGRAVEVGRVDAQWATAEPSMCGL